MILGIMAILSVLSGGAVCAATGAFAGSSWLWMLPAGAAGAFLLMALAFFLFLLICCALVDIQKPQETDSPFYRRLTYFTAKLALEILQVRMHVRGMENVPTDGRILMVSNHLNDMDPVVLMYHFRKKQLAFISKRENSTMFVVGKLMHRTMCQMINRENDREALKTILTCIQILKEDKASVAVFPEGGILSYDGKLHHFRPGVFKIAQKANVPIVVCVLKGTNVVVKNIKRLKPTYVEMHLLDVIPVEELTGRNTVQLGERIRTMMIADLGEEWRVTEE